MRPGSDLNDSSTGSREIGDRICQPELTTRRMKARRSRLDAKGPQWGIVGLRGPLITEDRLTHDRGQIGLDPAQQCGSRR